MKAAYIEHVGGPDAIIYGDLPIPPLEPDKVLVKVIAAAVDPIDTYIRSGKYKQELQFPFVIGRDMVGIVEDTGKSVTDFIAGDRVWCNNQGYGGRHGTFAEFVLIDPLYLYHAPENVELQNLVASAHSALTAVVALVTKAALQPGQAIFINGGSGNVGLCAVQLAKYLGARVAVTAGTTLKEEWCYQSGADLVVNYKTDSIAEEVRKFAPSGLDVYWDLTKTPDVQQAIDLVAPRARIILSSGLTHSTQFNVGSFYTRNCTLFGFTITDLSMTELRECAVIINEYLNRGIFRSQIAAVFPLSDTRRAHELMDTGDVNGKFVIKVSDQ